MEELQKTLRQIKAENACDKTIKLETRMTKYLGHKGIM